jgi:hypothetical protein
MGHFVRWEECSSAPSATFVDYSILFAGEPWYIGDYTSTIQDQASLLSPADNVGCPSNGDRTFSLDADIV